MFPHKPVWTDTIYTCHNKASVPAARMINSINYDGVCKYAHPGILLPGDKLFLLHLISYFSASTTVHQVQWRILCFCAVILSYIVFFCHSFLCVKRKIVWLYSTCSPTRSTGTYPSGAVWTLKTFTYILPASYIYSTVSRLQRWHFRYESHAACFEEQHPQLV